jgi:hypothetical protein
VEAKSRRPGVLGRKGQAPDAATPTVDVQELMPGRLSRNEFDRLAEAAPPVRGRPLRHAVGGARLPSSTRLLPLAFRSAPDYELQPLARLGDPRAVDAALKRLLLAPRLFRARDRAAQRTLRALKTRRAHQPHQPPSCDPRARLLDPLSDQIDEVTSHARAAQRRRALARPPAAST